MEGKGTFPEKKSQKNNTLPSKEKEVPMRLMYIVLLLPLTSTLLFCPKKATPPSPQEPSTPPSTQEPTTRPLDLAKEQTGTGALGEGVTIRPLQTVYFDFDDYSIRADQREKIVQAAEWLKQNPQVRIRLEGHADERGPADYNMALGLKRARSVKDLLVALGVEGKRIELKSYGEEMPADPGHDESAWAKNRRVEYVVLK
jgi:peptidoglycan-associated lipoprotein